LFLPYFGKDYPKEDKTENILFHLSSPRVEIHEPLTLRRGPLAGKIPRSDGALLRAVRHCVRRPRL
jgi:hypothetical protein